MDAASVHLGWSFGFAPLISDLKKIARAIPQIRGKLRELARKGTLPYTVTRSSVGEFSFNATAAGSYYNPETNADAGFTHWYEKFTPVQKPTRLVGVRGIRRTEYNTTTFQELDYLFSRFIATTPSSLAWEKIPFSFVIDWFVDVSGIVRKLDETLGFDSKKILRCWSSETYHCYIGAIARSNGYEKNSVAGQVVMQTELKEYYRNPLEPTSLVVSQDRFGKKQAVISASLLYQKVANLLLKLRKR
jgi:hypothetical protein